MIQPIIDSGGFEDLEDDRDYHFISSDFPNRSQSLGRAVRLKHSYTPHSQDDVNCCVSCSIVTCMEVLDLHNPPALRLSPLYHYYKARQLMGRPASDLRGMSIQVGFKTLLKHGVCKESLHAHPISKQYAAVKPNRTSEQDAKEHRIRRIRPRLWAYRKLSNKKEMIDVLLSRRPIVLGFRLSDGYKNISKENPVHHIPNQISDIKHAVTIIGFDIRKNTNDGYNGAFLVKDSRGPNFGNKGHWWFPFSLISPRIVLQTWVITDINY